MKYMKLYEQWLNEPVQEQDPTTLFLNGIITEKEWIQYYDGEVEKMNEAIGQVIKQGVDAVSSWIQTKVIPWVTQNLLTPIKSIYNWIETQLIG